MSTAHHARLIRLCLFCPGDSEEVRTGRWFREARSRGASGEALRRFDPVESEFQDSSASMIWEYVRERYDRYGTVPSLSELRFDIQKANQEGQLDNPTTLTLASYLDTVSALPAFHEAYDLAIEETLKTIDQQVLRGHIFEATRLSQEDPGAAVDLLRAIRPLSTGTTLTSYNKVANERWNNYLLAREGKTPCAQTGIRQFDYRTGGVWPGDLIIVAARTSKGKSFLLTHISHQMYLAGKLVLVYSSEMLASQYMSRYEGLRIGADPRNIRRGWLGSQEMEERYREHLQERLGTAGGDIVLVDRKGRGRARVSQLSDLVKQAEDQYGRKVDAMFVDPLYHLLTTDPRRDRDADWLKSRYVAEELKELMVQNDMPGFAAHQLKRPDGAGPVTTADLKYADAIGDECDFLLAIDGVDKNTWKVSVPKARGDECDWEFVLEVDLARGMIVEPDDHLPKAPERSPMAISNMSLVEEEEEVLS